MKNIMKEEMISKKNSLYEIPMTEAAQLAHNWRTSLTDPNGVKAFRIDVAELQEIIAQHPTAEYIRVYFGRDGSPTGPEKLVLIPVGHDEMDMVASGKAYDFTKPCPPTCDVHSIMYNIVT
jgi:hypothetical protein